MLLISAAVIDFGCVAQGFTYSIDAVVTNNDSRMQRIKVTTVKVSGPDINKVSASTSSQAFAPGMTAVVKVELRAEVAARTSEYEIIVLTEGYTEELRLRVKSVIIPMEIFKYFAKTLRLQKRPVTKAGVTVVDTLMLANMGTLGMTGGIIDDKSFYSTTGTAITNTTSGQSVFTEALLDDDDVSDLLDIPMTPHTYWDPKSSTLKVDPQLCRVIVDGTLGMEECIARTEKLRTDRHEELETLGFYTQTAIDKQYMFSASAILSEDGDRSMGRGQLEKEEEEEDM